MFFLNSVELILLNFFLLCLSITLVNKINLNSTIKSVKVKIFLILTFILYSVLSLVFFHLNFGLLSDVLLFNNYVINYFFLGLKNEVGVFSDSILVMEYFNFFNQNLSFFKPFWFNYFGELDTLSLVFVFMSHVVSFMIVCFSSIHFDFNNLNNNLKALQSFKITLNAVIIMTIMMDLLFITDNLLLIFFLAELSLIPLSFLMVKDNTIFWRIFKYESFYENKRPLALYYLIFFTIASGGFGFISLLIIYFMFGTLSISMLSTYNNIVNIHYYNDILFTLNNNTILSLNTFSAITLFFSFACVLIWILIKIPLAPVHIWLPKAHVEGSTESSMLLAGIILKITVYIFMRFCSIPVYSLLLEQYRPVLLSVAVTTAVLGAFGGLLTVDMKRITAFSSVSHMGIILSAGFYISGTTSAIPPFIILLLTHTIVSTAMFMIIGCIYKSKQGRFVSRNRLTYGGLLFVFPFYFLFGAIIFANLNIPLTIGFIGELGVLITTINSGLTLGIILCFSSFILLLPMLAMLGQVLLGPVRLVDFLKLKSLLILSNLKIDFFFKRLVFNKIIWSKFFFNFYLLNRIYFSMILNIILVFGVSTILFVNFLNDFLIVTDLNLLNTRHC